nr:hypothetical protein [Tanacetum cinerariifolium]GFA34145.1 hypothetical protein [Tanacetum cinerariifolium]
MEAGFLNGKSASKMGGLAAKVKNIEGKLLGKDGKPLKSILKSGKGNPKQALPDGVPYRIRKGMGMNTNMVEPVGTSYIQQSDPISSSGTREGVKTDSSNDDNTMPIHTIPITEPIRDADKNNNAAFGSDEWLKQSIPRKVQVSVLTNDVKVLAANVAIPIAVVDEICDKFANTLYGYFISERLAFPIVEAYINNVWAIYGFERAIFRNGFFFFKFSSQDGMVKTLEGGPWFI